MASANGVSDEFPNYFISENSIINPTSGRKSFGKKCFKINANTTELLVNNQTIENIIRQHNLNRETKIKSLAAMQRINLKPKSVLRMAENKTYLINQSFDKFNAFSVRDKHQAVSNSHSSNTLRHSVDVTKDSRHLPELLMPSQVDCVLKKTNQRLLRNADTSKLKRTPLLGNKTYLTIPQKPVEVYDCINNVSKLFCPPNIELENYSGYRDNYYRVISSKNKPFNKSVGYFSYFAEQAKREKDIKDLYKKKNQSKHRESLNSSSESYVKENLRYSVELSKHKNITDESSKLRAPANASAIDNEVNQKQRKIYQLL